MHRGRASRCMHTCNARDPLATMAMRGRLSVINSEHCQYLGWKRCGATVRNNEAIINESRLRARGIAFSNGGKLSLHRCCIVNVTRSVQFQCGIHKDSIHVSLLFFVSFENGLIDEWEIGWDVKEKKDFFFFLLIRGEDKGEVILK